MDLAFLNVQQCFHSTRVAFSKLILGYLIHRSVCSLYFKNGLILFLSATLFYSYTVSFTEVTWLLECDLMLIMDWKSCKEPSKPSFTL